MEEHIIMWHLHGGRPYFYLIPIGLRDEFNGTDFEFDWEGQPFHEYRITRSDSIIIRDYEEEII